MSVKFIHLVWTHSPFTGGELLTHLALADFANDEGKCWPSVATICKKSRLSERHTRRIIAMFEKQGYLVRDSRDGNSNLYTLTADKMTPDMASPLTPATGEPLTPMTATPDAHVSQTIKNRNLELTKAVEWLADQYRVLFGKKRWTLTKARIDKATKRLQECLEATNGDLKHAVGMMLAAMKALRASEWHMGANDRNTPFNDWENHLYRSQEQTEKWIEKSNYLGKGVAGEFKSSPDALEQMRARRAAKRD